ncbi:hypothetical protein L204_101937 [Cryptococcus depauperatus]
MTRESLNPHLKVASLNKLAIRGIRSFDDKHVQVIEFYSPLTVIVGHNGSGKTTIIECLKYATTGDLPPNTKGGAFVHDPKMAGEKEVKAQVRLRFWNAKRERMTATRNLQVTTKKTGALTMKTLEGILAKTDMDGGDGKRNTISTKCSEMDEEVPYLFGVSKSILENVIFCHQEESNWPLSEPAALKKKFDDIFEATKYTKALENIKSLRKERTQELKVDKERLKFLKADKDKAERMRKELQESLTIEARKQTELEDLKERYETLKIRNANFYEDATQFRGIFEKYESLKEKIKMYEENQKYARDNMQEMQESTEELLHMLGSFDAHLNKLVDQRNAKEREKDLEEGKYENLRSKERSFASKQGALLANQHMYERNVKERELAMKKVAKELDLAEYNNFPLPNSEVEKFVDMLHDFVRKAENDLKKLHTENWKSERDLQEELNKLSSSKAATLAIRSSKTEQIGNLKQKILRAEDEYHSFFDPSAEIDILLNKIKELTSDYDELQNQIREAKYDEQMREKGLSIRQKDLERDKISAELAILNRKADSRAKLDLQRRDLDNKKAQIENLLTSYAVKFWEYVNEDIYKIDLDEIEDKAVGAISRKDRELTQEESAASASNRELSQLHTSIGYLKGNLQDIEAEATDLQATIKQELLAGDFEETMNLSGAIQEATDEYNYAQSLLATKKGSKTMWEHFLKTVQIGHKCDACNREINSNEENAVITHMQEKLEEALHADNLSIKQSEEDEKLWGATMRRLQSMVPSQDKVTRLLETVIPDMNLQIKDCEERLEGLVAQVDDAKARVQKVKNDIRDIQNFRSALSLVARLNNEIKDLEGDVTRLKTELESSGSSKTVEEVQKEDDRLNQEIKALTREQQRISSEKETKLNMLRSTADEISRRNTTVAKHQAHLEKIKLADEALTDMRNMQAVLEAELLKCESDAKATETPWKEKHDELTRFRTERASAESHLGEELNKFQSSLREIEGKHKICQTYLTEGNDKRIQENDSYIADLKRQVSQCNNTRAKIDTEIARLSSELSKSESLKTNISSNLRYREDAVKIEKVKKELEILDIKEAAESRVKFNQEYGGMLDEATEAQGQMSVTQGHLLAMIENRKKLEKTLKTDYKNIDNVFKEQLIKTTISEYANNDLEKYGKALDNAILRYHSIKMDEINDTIGHLWNKTYQGTDIDGIRIVSAHDESNSSSTRKSYNYRVTMVKNEVELDMRGRCSAGQKVLASIIIRLALAESFGQGCGVLALDEPTTNLDQENINALAEALAEIIRERRQQANFQLIVITHDEGFLQRLAAHDVLEYYWRVSRDASQKSVLERQRVGI